MKNRNNININMYKINKDFFLWLSGYTDAKGLFGVYPSNDTNNSYVKLTFTIITPIYDYPALIDVINGIGVGKSSFTLTVSKSKNLVEFIIRKREVLTTNIQPIFENYPLYSNKRINYLLFKEGLNKRNELSNNMVLPPENIQYFIDLKEKILHTNLTSVVDWKTNVNINWLIGLIDGNGKFIMKQNSYNNYYFGFTITMPYTSKSVLEDINKYFIDLSIKDNLDYELINKLKLNSDNVLNMSSNENNTEVIYYENGLSFGIKKIDAAILTKNNFTYLLFILFPLFKKYKFHTRKYVDFMLCYISMLYLLKIKINNNINFIDIIYNIYIDKKHFFNKLTYDLLDKLYIQVYNLDLNNESNLDKINTTLYELKDNFYSNVINITLIKDYINKFKLNFNSEDENDNNIVDVIKPNNNIINEINEHMINKLKINGVDILDTNTNNIVYNALSLRDAAIYLNIKWSTFFHNYTNNNNYLFNNKYQIVSAFDTSDNKIYCMYYNNNNNIYYLLGVFNNMQETFYFLYKNNTAIKEIKTVINSKDINDIYYFDNNHIPNSYINVNDIYLNNTNSIDNTIFNKKITKLKTKVHDLKRDLKLVNEFESMSQASVYLELPYSTLKAYFRKFKNYLIIINKNSIYLVYR